MNKAYQNKGIFSVKSAYKVCRRHFLINQSRNGGAASSGSTSSGEDLWRGIWNMECPNKIKHFL
jgi:hypothetical protein